MTEVGLIRVRIAVIAVGFALVGAAAAGVFDNSEWTLVVAPAIPAAVAVVLATRPFVARVSGAIAAVLLAVVLAVAVAGGSIDEVVDSFTSGVRGLLSTEWPSPTRPDLVGTLAAAIASLCAVSAELAARRRFHLLGLLPLFIGYLGVVALSAPFGASWVWLIGLAAVSIVFALLRNEGTLRDRLTFLSGERRIVGLLVVAVVLVALLAVPLSLGTRADPRRVRPADQTAALLDPIEATIALRALDPPAELHIVTPNDGGALPVRWRTAALTSYDGRRWSPSLTLRPIGSTLGPTTGPTVDADVTFLDTGLTLVPLAGPPVEVDAQVETDSGRTVVRLAKRPSADHPIRVVSNAPVGASDAAAVGVAARLVDESVSGLTQLAERLAGDGTDLERLDRLESTLRNDFVLDSNVQGGGLARALIDRFLRDTQRGTSEQFATAFVLLARSLGIESRVATGFVADGDGDTPVTVGASGERLVLASTDAVVWPEVQLNDGRWVAYNPVPAEEAADGPPPPPEPQVQAPAAPQPPVPPPPESDSDAVTPDDTADATPRSTLSTVIDWTLRGAATLSAILLPFVIAAGIIAAVKYRRRRRRLRADDPADRIRGAWASATDALVDAGLHIGASATDGEIAARGEPFAPDAARDLRRLATMSSAATFGTPRHPTLLADDAASCLGAVEGALASVRTRWQRLRWRLSLRSLRPSTRSPLRD